MKRTVGLLRWVFGISLLVFSVASIGEAAQLATGAEVGGQVEARVAHVSAGIGDDDAIEIQAMRHEYNLQLVFALKGSGAYLADIKVSIRDAAGGKVLAAPSPGPLFFARLRPGQYLIEAEYRGSLLSKPVRVSEGRRQDVFFYWEHE